MRQFTARFDFAVLGALLGMVPPALALAADLHLVLSPFLAVLQLWRVLSAFVVSSLMAFAACGVLESPVGDPVRRWVVAALQPDRPEEPRGW